MRAVAVGLVILYHYFQPDVPGGFVGVDVFFVISGFVIAGLIFREVRAKGSVSLLSFYARRARRILPASALCLAATVTVAVLLLGRIGAYTIAQDAIAAALFVANFHFAAQNVNYFASNLPPSPILHYWSLSVEEQFYFVFPSLVAIVALFTKAVRRYVVWVVAAIVVGSFWWSIVETTADPTNAYYSIATRAWELGLGVLCAGVIHRFGHLRRGIAISAGWLGVVLIGYAAFAFNGATPYPGSVAAVPVLGAVLLILGGASQPPASATALLATRPMVVVGDLSYSLYLWHFPVIALAAQYVTTPLTVPDRLGLLALAIALAVASFILVEQPIRGSNLLRRFPVPSIGLGACCVGAVVLVAYVPIWSVQVRPGTVVVGHPALKALQADIRTALTEKNVPGRTDPALSLFLPESSFGYGPMIANCDPGTYETTVPFCAYGDTTAKTTVVLYGNSQAQSWAPALVTLADADHFRLVPIAKAACGTFVDNGYIAPDGLVSPVCKEFVQWAIARMNALHPAVIVIASTPGIVLRPGASPTQVAANGRLPQSSVESPPPGRTASDFAKLVAALAPSGARIVLMGAIPQRFAHNDGGLSPTGCLLSNLNSEQRCALVEPTIHNSEWLESFKAAAAQAHVSFINVDPLLCVAGRCPPIVSQVLVKYDQLHLSKQYVTYSASALGELFGDLLPRPAAAHRT